MKQVNWGIIGCGDVTEVKSGPAFNLVEHSTLVAVMRRNAEKAADYAKRHNVPKWYSNANDLVNDSEVNAIYVATPPDTHAEYAIKAMQAGKPVYVEKPMALNYKEAMQMISVSEKTKVPLYVAYYRRALPGFLKIKELIEAGEIGQVRTVNIELSKPQTADEKTGKPGWRVNPDIAGGGHFFDLGSHQLDYLDFLFGPVKAIDSYVTNQTGLYKAEDFVSASFLFGNNIICHGKWLFSSLNQKTDVIDIVGDKGRISFSCFGFTPITLNNLNGSKEFNYPKPKHVQLDFITNIVNDLLSNERSLMNGISAARTSWVLDETVKEYYTT